MEHSPNTSPSADGCGSFPRTAPIPHTRFPHTHFNFFFFFFCLHLFYGVWVLLSHGAGPKAGAERSREGRAGCGSSRQREDAAAGQGVRFGCSLRKSPRGLRHSTYKTDPLHISYRKRYECRRRRNPSVFFVSKNVMCHLLI